VTLTTVEVGGETEQVGGGGRHMEEERRAEKVGISSRPVSATRYVHGDLVQAIVMLAPAGSDVGFRILAIARRRSPPQSRPRAARAV
jgi:hypothetical protein